MEGRIAALEAKCEMQETQIALLQDTVRHLQSALTANAEGYALSTADGIASMVVSGNRASFFAKTHTIED